jgi:heptosyltransferase-2
MDLSSRRLLSGRDVDLYTDEKNSHLYLNDKYFNKIFTNCNDLYTREYDLVILDSFSSRTIKIKAKIAPKIIFVGMFGYFNGPEVNRILFSFHQMNYLLDYPMTEEEIIDNAQNSLSISKKDQEIVQNIVPKNYITISLGGEWKYKTYQKWREVLNQLLLDNKNIKIIFVGSNNALNLSKQLLKNFPENQLLNFTSLLSFNQTAEVIRKSDVFLCCDGGLMHAATALDSKIVALFARLTPEMLLTKNTNIYSLYDQENVNNIRPSKVISKYFEAINSADNHL